MSFGKKGASRGKVLRPSYCAWLSLGKRYFEKEDDAFFAAPRQALGKGTLKGEGRPPRPSETGVKF